MKKKILVVCQHFWPESFRLNDICDGFVENGYEVEVLCGLPNYPSGKLTEGYGVFKNRKQTHNGIKIRRVLEIPRGNNSNLRIFLNYISFPLFSLFHIPRLLTQKYDKIFLYQLSPVMMSIAGLIIGKIKKIETTMYVLDLWPENLYSVLQIKNRFLRSIAKSVSHWHYKKADKLIAISEKMKSILLEITGFDEDRIAFIPQCCEKLYEQNIADEELEKRFLGKFNIVFTGNISPAQSFETIIESAKLLVEDKISDFCFIIVGDGMSFKWLKETVHNENLDDYFSFEGYRPITDIPKYTNIANGLLACLKKSDLLDCTIPAKVMSYFAAGKPILLSMDGEAQSIVNAFRCGFATEAENAFALYQSIKCLYSMSESEHREMGNRAREYHFANFERNINLQKMINFIFK